MKTGWKIAGVAVLVAILGVAALGSVALAQADTSSSGPFDFAGRFKERLAGILGISVDEYTTAVERAGQQVIDEAKAEGWLTDEQAERLQERLTQERAPGLWGFGKGMGAFGRGIGHMGRLGTGDGLLSIAASELGMTESELATAVRDGTSIADLAKEKGVDVQAIVSAYAVQMKERLDQAVADGKITQTQADYMLEQMQSHITAQIEGTWNGLGGRGMRGGMMKGCPGMGGF